MIDTGRMAREEDLAEPAFSDVHLYQEGAREAHRFVEHFSWCERVNVVYFDRGFDRVAVWLVEISPLKDADPVLWVINGDIPPAYLDTEELPNGAFALKTYVEILKEWVEAVEIGDPVDEMMPVLSNGGFTPLEPAAEIAEMLRSRLSFIEKKLLPMWSDDLADWPFN